MGRFASALSRTLALAALPALGLADQITVPGDAPDLQAAVDLAQAGDVILVSGVEDPITVDKPLTILGDPGVTIRIGFGGPSCGPAAVTLAGPGSGTLSLVGVTTQSAQDCYSPPPAISGGGFDELHIQDCDIQPTASGLTGIGNGAPGIRVDVPFLLVSDSTVRGGNADTDFCMGSLPGGGYPAIDAPASRVVLLDSTLRGGDGGWNCCFMCICPLSIEGLGGEGGDGVVAAELLMSASTVEAGRGSTYLAYEDFEDGRVTECGTRPDGEAMVADSQAALPGAMSLQGEQRLGGQIQIRFTAGPQTMLFFSDGIRRPSLHPGLGWTFQRLNPNTALGPFAPGDPVTLEFSIPDNPVLIGTEYIAQLFDGVLGLSRPVVGVLRP